MTETSDIVGSIGVAILLLAFLLNLMKKIPQDSRSYMLMNFIGAGLAGYAAWLIHFWPFVVLEGTWSVAAAVALLRRSGRVRA